MNPVIETCANTVEQAKRCLERMACEPHELGDSDRRPNHRIHRCFECTVKTDAHSNMYMWSVFPKNVLMYI